MTPRELIAQWRAEAEHCKTQGANGWVPMAVRSDNLLRAEMLEQHASALEAALPSVERDSLRLDWLEAQRARALPMATLSVAPEDYWVVEWSNGIGSGNHDADAPSLRAALDAAMSQPPTSRR